MGVWRLSAWSSTIRAGDVRPKHTGQAASSRNLTATNCGCEFLLGALAASMHHLVTPTAADTVANRHTRRAKARRS